MACNTDTLPHSEIAVADSLAHAPGSALGAGSNRRHQRLRWAAPVCHMPGIAGPGAGESETYLHQLTNPLQLQPTHCPHHAVWIIDCKDMQHGCASLDLQIVRMRHAAMKLAKQHYFRTTQDW